MRFTKPAIAGLALQQGKAELIAFDDDLPGFGIRLRAGGKRTWIVQYRVGKKQRRLTLGSAAAIGLDQARDQAKKTIAKVHLDHDPQADKVRLRAQAALTFGSLLDRYLAIKRDRLRPHSYGETERPLLRYWAPLHEMPVSKIERVDIAARLGTLAIEHGPASADRARAVLSAYFTWAMREGLVQANPVIGTNRPAGAVTRDRVLTDAELVEIWRACLDNDHGRIVRLLILTGQRREEISALGWSEIDLEKAVISLPGNRTKNYRPHEVPLSDEALTILNATPHRDGRDLIFGAGDGPFSGYSGSKAALDKRILAARVATAAPGAKAQAMVEWRLHDVRRTVATRMADIGIQPHVIEAVLNHVSGHRAGIAGVYNRSLYVAEKRDALVRWGNHVEALVANREAKVVPIRRA
jgi:integrase